jgi:hypothetical protein
MSAFVPPVEGHPNRVPFEGILAKVDVPSDRPPSGSRGHRVLLTRQAAENALPTLLGMAIDYRPGWDGHDARRKIGILTDVNLIGRKLHVQGFIYARDFPEVTASILSQHHDAMGMSYEVSDAKVEDVRSDIWKLTRVTFTGAAILLRGKAAYADTSFKVKR